MQTGQNFIINGNWYVVQHSFTWKLGILTYSQAHNEVPLYAATFVDDMYVDYDLAQNTASLVKNCKQFITNSMYHNAIRAKTDDVLTSLFALRDDNID